jgi:hypothetical protein
VEDYLCDSVSISSYQLAYTTFDGENTLDDGRSWYAETFNAEGYFADASTTYSYYNDISLTGAYPSDYYSDTTSSSSTISSSSTAVGAPATSSSSGSPRLDEGKKSSTPIGAIVGGVIGGLALIALVAAGAFILKRKYQKNDADSSISNPPLTCNSGSGNIHAGASEMDATGSNTPMQHEFYKPAAAQQAYSPSSFHQYEPVPTSEIPAFQQSHYQDETFLTPSPDLGRTGSTARVSMMTANESAPTSPIPAFSHLPANIVEAPGSYEYLEPQVLNETHGRTHEAPGPSSPA